MSPRHFKFILSKTEFNSPAQLVISPSSQAFNFIVSVHCFSSLFTSNWSLNCVSLSKVSQIQFFSLSQLLFFFRPCCPQSLWPNWTPYFIFLPPKITLLPWINFLKPKWLCCSPTKISLMVLPLSTHSNPNHSRPFVIWTQCVRPASPLPCPTKNHCALATQTAPCFLNKPVCFCLGAFTYSVPAASWKKLNLKQKWRISHMGPQENDT